MGNVGEHHLAVLVSSCDRFRDLWGPFFTLFWRHWPDCPFPVFLITNRETHADPRVTSLPVGEDRQWASNCLAALARVPHPYLLYLQEDYLLSGPVDTARIRQLLNCLSQRSAGYLRLLPNPGPDRRLPGHPDLGLIDPGSQFRTSLQAAFWRADVLTKLLVNGETGRDMEDLGSRRSAALTCEFLSLRAGRGAGRRPPLPYPLGGVVWNGCWTHAGLRLCRREGIALELAARPVLPWSRELPIRLRLDHPLDRYYYPLRQRLGQWLRARGLRPHRPA